MGELTRLRLPRLGETMEEARVVEWLTPEGASFTRGDILLEVETDKTVVEVPALRDGVMRKHLVQPGDTVELDAEIAEVEGESVGARAPAPAGAEAAPAAPTAAPYEASAPAPAPTSDPRVPASPAARKLAAKLGVDLRDVTGTGPKGRVQGHDLRAGADRQMVAGKTVAVFLHGLFADRSAWRGLPDKLGSDRLTTLALDLPGHGTSGPAPATLPALIEDVRRSIDSHARDCPLVLVGHSFGAYLAAALAAQMGARVRGLILSAPAGLGLRIHPGFIPAMIDAQTPETLLHALDLLGPESGPISDTMLRAELARLNAARAGHREAANLAAQDGLQRLDIRPLLAQVAPVPHLLLGMQDRIFDWQDALHLPARAALHLSANAGHMPHLAEPGLVQELIRASV